MTRRSPRNLPNAVPAEPISFLRELARSEPDQPAVMTPNAGQLSYERLFGILSTWSSAFRDMGLRNGDRVAAILPDGAIAAQVMLALADVVACCPLDPMLTEEEYARRIELVRPAALVVVQGTSARARAASARTGVPVIDVVVGSPATGSDIRPLPPDGPLARWPETVTLPPGLLLATSGTTGAAKLAVLPWPVMFAAAGATVQAYRLTAADRRLNIMPLFHVQGLVGSVLASLVSGGSVVCAPGFDPAAVSRRWLTDDVTWFSATPAMHQQILDAAAPEWCPPSRLRFVRCGSAGLPTALRERLERRYRVPVIESYGMTEAHQIASTPLPPRTAAGMVPTGSAVAIEVRPGMISTDPGRPGPVLVRGDNVVSQYIPPDPSAFTDGWFRTGDLGELAADGSLRLTGRLRELIIRGGENIAPREIEETLLAHAGVREACVVGIPDPVLGERVAAAVTLADAAATDQVALRSFAAGRLAPHKVPEFVAVFSEMPVTGPGKVARREVARRLSVYRRRDNDVPGVADQSGEAGPDDTRTVLLGIWRQILRISTLGPEDDFFASGGDSLAATVLLGMVKDRYGVTLTPLQLFDETPTVAAMAARLDSQAPAPASAVMR